MKQFLTRRNLIGILVIILAFVFYFPVMEKHTQSFKFVDEDEHMVVASLMNKGWGLYSDISLNHQPLPYIGSALIQKISNPPNVFMLVKRHREAIFLWSYLWILILFYRFGWKIMPGFFAFESIKYFVLGNEFLAESLVVYPVAYLVGIVIEMISENKKRSEDIFIGFLSAMLVLFLLPLAAPLGIFMAMRYWGGKAESIRKFILGVLLIMIPVFIYISFWDYFRETIVNNIKYAMPAVSEIDTVKDMIYVLTLPFRSLFEGTNLLSIWTRIFSIIWIAFFVKAVGDRKHLKKWYLTSGLVILFISLNLRVADVGAYYYKGFHLLPWLAAACLGSSMIVVDWTRNLRMKVKVVVFGIGLLTMGILMFNVHSPVRADIDTGTENYINYSPVATTSQVIKIFATDGDSLMVLPTEALNYWMTGLDPVGSQVTYYDWQYQVLKNRLEFEKILEVNRPDFIVFNNDNSGYSPFIEDIIKTDYLKLFEYSQNSGGFVGTYVSENKIGKVNKDTWDEYISVPIEIPEESLEWYEENVKKN